MTSQIVYAMLSILCTIFAFSFILEFLNEGEEGGGVLL